MSSLPSASANQRSIRLIPHTSARQRESQDSLGIGKLLDGQMRAVISIIKERKLLKEPPPPPTQDKGIVISAGGRYAEWGLVNARWTRDQGVQLPIQVWHLGPAEIPTHLRKHFAALDVELIDAHRVREQHWHRALKGWSLKQYAAMRAPWQTVLSLDADAFITCDPAHVLEDPEFVETGAFFCADINKCRTSDWAHFFCNVPAPAQEMESGFFAWDRTLAWEGIKMTHWIAEHSEVWDRHIYGDKSRPELGFGTTNTPFLFANQPQWMGWGIRHSWKGQTICDHGMGWKRGEHTPPNPILPRLFEWVRSLK
jgi:hypothetical protein